MNRLNLYIIATILFLLSSCQTSEKPAKQASLAMNISLSAAEQKNYENALEAIKTGHLDSAISALTKITSNHPDHAGAWINLANSYLNAKKINEAENALAHVQNIKPAIPEALNLQGLIETEKGEYTKAEKSYLGAIQLKENYAFAHYNLALLYDIYYQTPDQALPHYERYLAINGDSDKSAKGWVTELKQKISKRNKP
jgi:tetratricopeptide (TPR) repeat protein